VLNCVVLWTTVYLDAAVCQLRAQGYPVLEEDLARLSPFVNTNLGVHGTYSFVLPDLAPGAIRELRDPEAVGECRSGTAIPPGRRKRTSGSRSPRRAGSRSRSPADRFMRVCHPPGRMQQPVKHGSPSSGPGGRPVSQALTYETA
jgi:hypothetical protein